MLVIGLSALLIGSVSAITLNELYKQSAPKTCKEYQGSYIWLPEKVSDIMHGSTVNLHFYMFDGNEIIFNGIVKDSAITNLKCGRTDDYDFEVWMSDVNALQLATSDKPVTTFITLWRNGEIRFEANGKENEMKLAYADQLMAQDDEPVPEWIKQIFNKYVE